MTASPQPCVRPCQGLGLAFADEVSQLIFDGARNGYLGDDLALATQRAGLDAAALGARSDGIADRVVPDQVVAPGDGDHQRQQQARDDETHRCRLVADPRDQRACEQQPEW